MKMLKLAYSSEFVLGAHMLANVTKGIAISKYHYFKLFWSRKIEKLLSTRMFYVFLTLIFTIVCYYHMSKIPNIKSVSIFRQIWIMITSNSNIDTMIKKMVGGEDKTIVDKIITKAICSLPIGKKCSLNKLATLFSFEVICQFTLDCDGQEIYDDFMALNKSLSIFYMFAPICKIVNFPEIRRIHKFIRE